MGNVLCCLPCIGKKTFSRFPLLAGRRDPQYYGGNNFDGYLPIATNVIEDIVDTTRSNEVWNSDKNNVQQESIPYRYDHEYLSSSEVRIQSQEQGTQRNYVQAVPVAIELQNSHNAQSTSSYSKDEIQSEGHKINGRPDSKLQSSIRSEKLVDRAISVSKSLDDDSNTTTQESNNITQVSQLGSSSEIVQTMGESEKDLLKSSNEVTYLHPPAPKAFIEGEFTEKGDDCDTKPSISLTFTLDDFGKGLKSKSNGVHENVIQDLGLSTISLDNTIKDQKPNSDRLSNLDRPVSETEITSNLPDHGSRRDIIKLRSSFFDVEDTVRDPKLITKEDIKSTKLKLAATLSRESLKREIENRDDIKLGSSSSTGLDDTIRDPKLIANEDSEGNKLKLVAPLSKKTLKHEVVNQDTAEERNDLTYISQPANKKQKGKTDDNKPSFSDKESLTYCSKENIQTTNSKQEMAPKRKPNDIHKLQPISPVSSQDIKDLKGLYPLKSHNFQNVEAEVNDSLSPIDFSVTKLKSRPVKSDEDVRMELLFKDSLHKTTRAFEEELLQKIYNEMSDESQIYNDQNLQDCGQIIENDHLSTQKQPQSKCNTDNTLEDQKTIPTPARILLIKQLNSEENVAKIINNPQMDISDFERTLVSCISWTRGRQKVTVNIQYNQDGISLSLSSFLRLYPQIVQDTNTKLRNKKVMAGVHRDREKISVIAVNKEEYDKVIDILNTDIQIDIYQISYSQDLLKNWISFCNILTNELASQLEVFIQCWLNTLEKTATAKIVGSSEAFEYVMLKVKKHLDKYKTNVSNSFDGENYNEFLIQKLPSAKVHYLKEHCKKEFLSLEEQYHCQLLYRPMETNGNKDDHQLILKYPNEHITTEIKEISETISSIPIITETLSSDSSQLSRITRYISQNQGKLKKVIGNLRYSLIVSDAKRDLVRFTREKTINVPVRNSKNKKRKCKKSQSISEESDIIYINQAGLCIKLIRGKIEKEGRQTDAIINFVDVKNPQAGAIAQAIFNADGPEYQLECSNFLKDLSKDSFRRTEGYRFGCKNIYHIPFLSSSRTLTWLGNMIYQCLEDANKESLKAISIPSLGAGGVGWSADTVAKEMIDSAIQFAKNNNGRCLNVVRFIIFEEDTPTYYSYNRIFKRIAKNLEIGLSLPALTSGDDIGLVERLTKVTTPVKKAKQDQLKVLFSVISTNIHHFLLNFCHGSINDAQTSAILNPTAVCSCHLQQGKLAERLDSYPRCYSESTLNTNKKMAASGKTIYTFCPYGMIDDFRSLLDSIHQNDDRSLTYPLASTESSEKDIYKLLTAITGFLNDHSTAKISLTRLDFITGNEELAHEIACWAQRLIAQKSDHDTSLLTQWKITQFNLYDEYGKKITIIADSDDTIVQVKKKLVDNASYWTCEEITEQDVVTATQDPAWLTLMNELWCQFGTIIVDNSDDGKIMIYGNKDDVFQVKDRIHQFAQEKDCQSIVEDMINEMLKKTQWNVAVDKAKHDFSPEMNREIERGYKTYVKNSSKSSCEIDADLVKIHRTACRNLLKKLHHLPSKQYWTLSEKEVQDSSQYLLVDVWKGAEYNEIVELVRSQGARLRRLQRIQNMNLYQRYLLRKTEVAELVQRFSPNSPVERRLYHRIDQSSISRICKSGFDRDYATATAETNYGKGTPFETSLLTASKGCNIVFMVGVLTGIYTLNPGKGGAILEFIPGSSNERFHSTVNDLKNPTTFVTFNDNAAYPEYILHLEHTNST
ncbi:Poly [ADP-ribose] polymerase 14 [Trichoplax sp. H2]|nr:Poly [ADP-ribose] polymerase 14 [Trichoplax sp. H2]|eukprot:RDD38023.1 Poly [ADP-ribose] polymerase 14 [Trichoplax sp. H2]